MATERLKTHFRVFFVQGQPGFSARAQYAVIREHTGLTPDSPHTKFYEPNPKKNAESLATAAVAARGGVVETAHGLRPLGKDLRSIAAALKAAKAEVVDKKNTIVAVQDVVTGLRSDRDAIEMLDMAQSKILGEAREPPEGYAEIGRRGGEGRWKQTRLQRKAEAIVREAWFNKELFKTDGAVAEWAGIGWSKSTCFNTFGPSGRDRGRRPSKTGAALAPSKAPAVEKKRAKRKASIKRKRK